MSTGGVAGGMLSADEQRLLSAQWRSLRRVATGVAVLSSPAVFVYLHKQQGWQIGWSLVASVIAVAAFRGALDLLFHRFIRWPSLFGIDTPELREEDVVARRRVWFWHFWAKVVYLIALVILTVYVVRLLRYGFDGTSFFGTFGDVGHWLAHTARRMPSYAAFGLIFVVYFIFNFGILLGPMLLMGVSQIRGYEPGDADWGVKLDDVRGQAEAKEEVRRVVNLWQSGEAFEQAGGKRERGLLFLGAPGTGKTMLAKAIATGFNSPIVTIPGSGFAQTFIGMDAIIVRFLARKAKRLARKWGGQCIVFIDEVDAVGMPGLARAALRRARARGRAARPPLAGTDPQPGRRLPGNVRRRRAARAQPAPDRDGRDRQPALRPAHAHEREQQGAGRPLLRSAASRPGPAAPAAYASRARPDLLHRRDERPDGDARPGADPPRAARPPRLVPHADQAGPARHLRPLSREGRARARPRHGKTPRRARPSHERLLAGDGGAGLLDGADARAPRRPPRLWLGGHRRGDDDRRIRDRDRNGVRAGGDAGCRDPRGRPRGCGARLPEGRRVDTPLDQAARRRARPPPGPREGGALQLLALRGDGAADVGPRRDGR